MFRNIRGKIRFNEPLRRHTTFRIGGPARFFIEPKDFSDLEATLTALKEKKIKALVIGAGSNILARDGLLPYAVIRLSSHFFQNLRIKGNVIEAGAGVSLNKLLNFAKDNGLSGLEFLAGIPGTLGGALVMNAGARGQEIGNLVAEVRITDYNNKIQCLETKKIKFSYRDSSLTKYIILSARLRLSKKEKSAIQDTMARCAVFRKMTQDYRYPSAGCIFKNPDGHYAGQLLDLCGFKGRKSGGAAVSLKHANFIVNRGKASAKDVLRLMSLAKTKVSRKFKIRLEPEIRIW